MSSTEGYFVQPTDGIFQSVFPSFDAEFSQLHSSIEDALEYFEELGVNRDDVIILDED